jgi:hypothetical protein
MSYLIKAALPFTLTLIVGLGASALMGPWHFESRCDRSHRQGAFNARLTDLNAHHCRAFGPSRMSHRAMEGILWSEMSDTSGTRTISCSSPATLDGGPVTQDAMITDLPSPRFWGNKDRKGSRFPESKILLRVTLDPSGSVSDVAQLSGSDYDRSDLDEVLIAARGIKFKPAMRDTLPVSQQISVLYSWQ